MDSIYSLKNNELEIKVSVFGAELQSIKSADGQEFLWQADPDYWARKAPVLFPIVGALKEGCYTYQGKSYSLGQHGFARDRQFALLERGDNYLCFRLVDDAASREIFPFSFTLDIEYRLVGSRLSVIYRVKNPADEVLLFSVGGHPAFSLNWEEDDQLSDYTLLFSDPETVKAALIKDGCLDEPSLSVFESQNQIPLHNHLFDQDALIFTEHASRKVTLTHKRSTKQLSVSFEDFPHLGVWSKPNARFVCIEPWQGHLDRVDHNQQLDDKAGIVRLEQGGLYEGMYEIQVTSG
jgi:galactose mutarotase-like enzyme